MSAFMSTFAATVNAAPAYLVNDVYRMYVAPDASERRCVRLSYVVGRCTLTPPALTHLI